MAESQDDTKPTPTRPGSKWATGKRRVLKDAPRERPGFHQGALVDRKAASRAELRRGKAKPAR